MIRRHRVRRRERGYASGNVLDGSGSGEEGEMMTEALCRKILRDHGQDKTLKRYRGKGKHIETNFFGHLKTFLKTGPLEGLQPGASISPEKEMIAAIRSSLVNP